LKTIARVETERASIYLQQLCKHFAHKRPVVFTPTRGEIKFDAGTCRLEATEGVLVLEADGADQEKVDHLQMVIEKHLSRFAFREPPNMNWQPA
jgi:hypothetical protein